MQLNVIDISSWQHPNGQEIDWEKVAASGIHGVVIKATQGTWYTNPFFKGDVEGATKAGILVGAYHFAEPARSGPDDQARYFHDAIVGLNLPLGGWLDLEETMPQGFFELQNWADAFMAATDTPQVPSGLYVNLDFANQMNGTGTVKRLWLANPSNDSNPYHPYMVQTGKGAVDGIVGAVDLDTIVNGRGVNPPDTGANPVQLPPAGVISPDEIAKLPQVEQGSKGYPVQDLQELLNARGAGIAVDGDFGPATEAATVAFQACAGLVIDGVVGPATWGKLAQTMSPTRIWAVGSEPEVRETSTGAAVATLQALLSHAGHGCTIDGAFGPQTAAAVEAFQGQHGLTVDGIAGPATWGALVHAD